MRKHQQCKFYGYQTCTHKDNEIMKKATQDIPKYHGGNYQIVSFPSQEEIDAICLACDKFIQK